MAKVPKAQDAGLGQVRQAGAGTTPMQSASTNPDMFGGGQDRTLQQAGQALGQISDQMAAAQEKVRNREDTLNRARALDSFHSEMFEKFTRLQDESDLTNPAVARQFNQEIRARAAQVLQTHSGSADSLVRLEERISDVAADFSRQMTMKTREAQKAFIMNKAGQQISNITAKVIEDPSYISQAFLDADGVIEEYSPAMSSEDEMSMIASAQEQIVLSAVQSYTDTGRYTDARDLVNEHPAFIQSLSAEKQRTLLSQINAGIHEQEKEERELQRKIRNYRAVANELGVELRPEQIFSAVTGISEQNTPTKKIEEFEKLTGKKRDELSPSVIAKIGFEVDLGDSETTDPNKDFGADQQLTAKGIGVRIKSHVEASTAVVTYRDKVISQVDSFIKDGNRQAGLAAMISFQKMIDDGAIVREGDIQLARTAQSLTERIETIKANLKKGDIVGPELMLEMQESALSFANTSLQASKTYIDPYLTDARERGFRMLDIGLPQQSYDMIFSGVETKQDNKANSLSKIEQIAQQNGVSVAELIESTATASGKTVEEVRKDFGLDQ